MVELTFLVAKKIASLSRLRKNCINMKIVKVSKLSKFCMLDNIVELSRMVELEKFV